MHECMTTRKVNNLKVLVTGVNGQLGYDVMKVLKRENFECFGTDKEEMDITKMSSVEKIIYNYKPDIVVHCAAYTAVDKAEEEHNVCRAINSLGTENIAKACEVIDAKMVYISTDYVFDGQGEKPFKSNDQPEPINFYGLTKLEGEKSVMKYVKKHFIIRVSWVFGVNGNNFVKTMLNLGRQKDELSIVADQIGSPTYTPDISEVILKMIMTEEYGVYHLTNKGYCSWMEFAKEIFNKAGINCNIVPVPTTSYITPAKRPLNSRMYTEDTFAKFSISQRTWQDALDAYLLELGEKAVN